VLTMAILTMAILTMAILTKVAEELEARVCLLWLYLLRWPRSSRPSCAYYGYTYYGYTYYGYTY